MNIFDLPLEEFEKELDKLISSYTKEELLQELIKCGLEVDNNDKE